MAIIIVIPKRKLLRLQEETILPEPLLPTISPTPSVGLTWAEILVHLADGVPYLRVTEELIIPVK